MIIYSTAKNYYLHQGAVSFTLNALGDPNKISIAVASGAAIMAYAADGNNTIIDYDMSLNYRRWTLYGSPTRFNRSDKVYVYARLSKTGDDALLIFPYEKIPIDPTYHGGSSSSSSSSSSSEEPSDADPNYYYIMLGALTPTVDGSNREWATGEELEYGQLDTPKQREEESAGLLDRMFRLDGDIIVAQKDLTFLSGKRLLLLRMSNYTNTSTVDVDRIVQSADIESYAFRGSDGSVITSAAILKYLQYYEAALDNKFLRKDQADSTAYKLTMGEAEVTGDAAVGGDMTVMGGADIGDDVSVGGELSVGDDVTLGGDIKSSNYTGTGMFAGTGWKIDQYGNADLESAKIRSFLEVVELLINRLQAQEGDTLFSDNDQIESVVHESGSTYLLTLKEKWEGYITSQQVGNIIKGIINTLAAKEAGISDESATSVETDGQNKYYTSWMQVTDTYNSTGGLLQKNQIRVVLYGDDYDDPVSGERVHITPAGKNFAPCAMMNIARWGCWQNPDEAGISAAEKASRIKRQQLFYISTTEGRIMKMTGVNSPILSEWNYGTTLGTVPDFIQNWSIAQRLIDGRDYLYAQGVIVGDFIKVDIQGRPLVQYVDCGDWYDGGAAGATPTVGHGIYLCNEYNADNLQWETHDVWHKGCRWRAKQHVPVNDGTLHYYEPGWNSPYWQFLEGDNNFRMEFVSSRGYRFHRGSVSTTITPHLFVGNEEITDEIAATYWSWTRSSDTRTSETIAADNTWNGNHTQMKALTLTDVDMPIWWATDNRIKFACHVQISDGLTLTFEL